MPGDGHFCCEGHSGADRIATILAEAEARASATGARLTPVRKRTLELLLQSHGALGAYEVLEKLAAEGFGTQPPVAYRALNFLVEQGLAHRIRRLNAFTACTHPGHTHRAVFLICESCNSVTEAMGDAVGDALCHAAEAVGFTLSRATIEAVGICASCESARA
ncbi:MAG: transcriptional repressor [Roseinatronobacter sp.]